MTYIEWKNELEDYLIDLPYDERQKVFSYFSEMYADRREAGYREEEIIAEFGAPYDAAQRVLGRSDEECTSPRRCADRNGRRREREQERQRDRERRERERRNEEYRQYGGQPCNQREDLTWLFVILCILFAAPLFGIVMAMIGITVGFCVAPIAVIASGFATVGGAIGGVVSGGPAAAGACMAGIGLVIVGVGFMLIPLFFGFVKLMWKAFNKLFSAIRNAFAGRRTV